jgi:hypothetical protein
MKVRIPIMVQDQTIAAAKSMDLTEECVFEAERFFLDGPVTARLAVLDFDASGALAAGTRFDATSGRYDVNPDAVESPAPTGLFYAYNAAFTTRPGKVGFVPLARLAAAAR